MTREDIDDRARFLNLRNTIVFVQELGAVPVINVKIGTSRPVNAWGSVRIFLLPDRDG